MHDWRRLVGQTGDLADVIVAVLSLASVRYGVSKLSLGQFYSIFSELERQFPNRIPRLGVRQFGKCVSSKRLGDALEDALRLGVQIANPQFQYLEVTRQMGEQNLKRLQKRAGADFLKTLKPVVGKFAALAKERRDQYSVTAS